MPYKKQTKPCYLCGKLMYEDGDGWCAGEPGSPAGFYSAHWACVHATRRTKATNYAAADVKGLFGVPHDCIIDWYNTRKRALQVSDEFRRWNPNSKFDFSVIAG